jgi:5,10-methylenetetrahydrofolate reductase
MWVKASRGCDFVTSQINFDAKAAVNCIASYQDLCDKTGVVPMTVFLSFAAVATRGILSLLERLDVVLPPKLRKRLIVADDFGQESVKIATEVCLEMLESLESEHIKVPIGLQVDQLGVKSERLTLELLDNVYHDFKQS